MNSVDGKDYVNTKIVGEDIDVPVKVSPEGHIVVRNLTADIKWDKILPVPTATTDVYIFSFDGVTTATITINYTDATKETVSPVTGITKVLA